MALPGTPGQRISDLCNGNHITQKELAEKIGVSASQLSRIVSGETRTVSSDILIGVAKEFKVSTDYILGLSTVSVRKSYDISELGLSEGAVRGLVTGAVDVQILNRLLEHRNFPKLIDLIRIYFQDTAAKGIMARNQLIEMATASLSDLMKEHPEHRAEAKQDLQFLNAQKMGEHEAEIEKIKNVFLAILRDIKGWLYSEPDRYHELTDSYDAEYFRYGVISGALDIEEQLNKVGSFTVTFNCKPFKYSFAGQQTIAEGSPRLIVTNPTAFDSKPYIKIYGNGLIRLMVQPEGQGTSSWGFAGVDEYIEIDSEHMNCYKGTVLKNDILSGEGFPVLKPGENSIACAGNVRRVEVVPRWQCL